MRRRLSPWPFALLLLAGCDGWPLYANLPIPDFDPPAPVVVEIDEEGDAPADSARSLGAPDLPAHIVVTGTAESCGYDIDAAGPAWPDRAYDTDGDGVPDGEAPSGHGWFTGDVDRFSFGATADLWFRATLRWDLAPASGLNDPWDPAADPAAGDADVDLLGVNSDGDVEILDDRGASRAAPEELPPSELAVGQSAGLLIGCHHGPPTGWTLEVDLLLP